MKITEKTLKEFKEDFDKAKVALEEKYGVSIEMGAITYDFDSFTCKMSVKNGTAEEAEKREFEQNVRYFEHLEVTKDMYGKPFIGANGQTYILCGLNPNAPKNCCIIRAEDGRKYRCSLDYIGIGGK